MMREIWRDPIGFLSRQLLYRVLTGGICATHTHPHADIPTQGNRNVVFQPCYIAENPITGNL